MNLSQSRQQSPQSSNSHVRLISRGAWSRLRQTLTVAPAFIVASSAVLGLRAFLAGEPIPQAVSTMLNILWGTSFVSILICGLYTLIGNDSSASSRSRPIHWPIILVSAYVGALAGAVLYFVISSQFMVQVDPLRELSLSATLIRQLSLLGGLDGCITGGMIGLLIDSLDNRAIRFTREGVSRYILLYTVLVAICAIYMLLREYLKVDAACLTLSFYLLVMLISLFRSSRR